MNSIPNIELKYSEWNYNSVVIDVKEKVSDYLASYISGLAQQFINTKIESNSLKMIKISIDRSLLNLAHEGKLIMNYNGEWDIVGFVWVN